MSNPERKPAVELNASLSPSQAATAAPSHEEEGAMGLQSMTAGRYEEIRRRPAEGRGVREIARALGCARATVREVCAKCAMVSGSLLMHPILQRPVVDATTGVADDRPRTGPGASVEVYLGG
jgi:hypothetical protein